jgi:hypothetical protein
MRRRGRVGERSTSPSALARSAAALILLLLLASFLGCGAGPFAEGSSRDLIVVTSLRDDSPEILLLRAVVERQALRTDDERCYRVQLARPEDPRAYRSTNVLLAGFGSYDHLPRPARSLRILLERGEVPYAFVTDLWRRGQAAGIFWTKSRTDWVSSLARAQNRFFLELDRTTFAAVRERVRALPRNAEAERRLDRELGIRMHVPRAYTVRVDRHAGAALLLDEGPPARLLRIRIAPFSPPMDDVLLARASLARLFRPHERTLRVAEPTLVPDEMLGVVRQVHGRWEDEEASAGGPFRFYEVALGGRRYEIDLAVFAPGRPKLPYLRELQALAETLFTP